MRGATFAASSLLLAGLVVAATAALGLGAGLAGLGMLATFAIGAVTFVATDGGPARPTRRMGEG